MNHFYIFLSVLIGLFFVFSIFFARKKPVKREFATGFLVTLLTFFLAFHPDQWGRIIFILLVNTVYTVYIILKKE